MMSLLWDEGEDDFLRRALIWCTGLFVDSSALNFNQSASRGCWRYIRHGALLGCRCANFRGTQSAELSALSGCSVSFDLLHKASCFANRAASLKSYLPADCRSTVDHYGRMQSPQIRNIGHSEDQTYDSPDPISI